MSWFVFFFFLISQKDCTKMKSEAVLMKAVSSVGKSFNNQLNKALDSSQ